MHRTHAGIASLLLLLVACHDSTAPEPPSQAAAALVVSIPETVVAGESFELTVTVPLADGTTADPAFNGAVTLSASSGSVTPAGIQVVGGVGSARVTLSGHAGNVTVTARSGNTTASATTTVLGDGPVASLAIVPGSILLPGSGSAHQLAVRAYDEAGRPTQADVQWTSSDPAVVSVTAAGAATATSEGGSAQITASAAGIVSAPVLALVATPADGAILVADGQVTRGPEAADPNADYGIGWRYTVTLDGIDVPEVGAMIIGTGQTALGGRVVSVAQVGDDVSLTLEVVTIEAMFERMQLSETMDLSNAEVSVPAEVARDFAVQRLAGGAIVFRRRSSDTLRTGSWSSVRSMEAASDLEFTLGPFKCKVEATVAPLQLTGAATFTITPNLNFTLDYDTEAGGLQRLALQGAVEAKISAEPRLESSFETKVDCGAKLAQIALPIGGPLALIFGGQVPIGVGFEINGKTTIANTGLRFELTADAATEIGIDCESGPCEMINTLDSGASGSFEPVLPDPTEQFRVDLRIFPYGFAKLTIGNPFLTALQFETFDVRAGLAQLLDFAPVSLQVENAGYGSGFRLSVFGQAKAGSKLDSFLDMLQISLVKVEARLEIPLAESPRGTFLITPASVRPGNDIQVGDRATFTVSLDHASYLGFQAVDAVELFWRKAAEDGGLTLESGRPGCTTMNSSPGQTTFTCETDFLEEHTGTQTFYAFIHARIFGLPIPIPLEIAADGYARLDVGETSSVLVASCSIRSHSEVSLTVVDSTTGVPRSVFLDADDDEVQCTDVESAGASTSASDFGSFQGVNGSGSANGSAGLFVETGAGGNVRSVSYTGSAAAEFNINGSLQFVDPGSRSSGNNAVFIGLRGQGAPVQYTLTGSVGEESRVALQGEDGIIFEANNDGTSMQPVSFTGLLEPGGALGIVASGYQSARAQASADLGSGAVQFTLTIGPAVAGVAGR
jgi:hypothetical protein